MPETSAAIVLDMGTTNCKVSCYACHDASLLAVRKFATPKQVSAQGEVDFDIEALWQMLRRVMAELAAASPLPVSRISIASFGESGVFVNEAGEILTPMLAWYDRRGEAYLSELSAEDKCELYAITGLPSHSNYSAFKMRWLLDNYGLREREDICWLHAPEVLAWRMTRLKRTEISLASRTQCLDVGRRQWSPRAAEILGIPVTTLAPLLPPGNLVGAVSAEMCAELGLSGNVSVTLAGHDHMVGARALQMQPGEVLNSTGTTEGILLLNRTPTLSEQAQSDKLANGCYSDGELYTLFASLPIGGYALEWLQKTFRLTREDTDAALDNIWQRYQQAAWSPDAVPVFIPHLRGSGSPNKNRSTRGLLYGLGDELSTETLLESVFLGLAMEYANCSACFSLPAEQTLKVIGPAVNNPFWLQLKADTLQCPVEAVAFEEAVSMGALMMACPELTPPQTNLAGRYLPNPNRARQLKEYQKQWQAFYHFKLQQEGITTCE